MRDDLNQVMAQSIREMIPSVQSETLEYLRKLVVDSGARTILEIGTGNARTALELASLDPGIHVVTIERDPHCLELARANIENSSCQNQVTLLEADALDPSLRDQLSGSFDLIFIDAAKSKYRQFFELYAPSLSPRGCIVTDNMYFHGLIFHPWTSPNRRTRALMKRLMEYHEFLEQLPDYQTEWLDIGDGIACTRRRP